MGYLNCLHCETPLEGRKQFCNQLCKSAEAKRLRKLRASDDAHWATISSQPTFDLTDVECYRLEARVASQEQHVFDGGQGFRFRDSEQEHSAERWDQLHESWTDKGADLDIWEIRRKDRARFGGIVLTDELAAELEFVRLTLGTAEFIKWAFGVDPDNLYRPVDQLNNPDFHNKLFGFELDELYEMETGEKA